MGTLHVDDQTVFIGLNTQIWWKDLKEQSFNKLSIEGSADAGDIRGMAVTRSADGFHVAVHTSTKALLLYTLPELTNHLTLQARHQLDRTASRVAFSQDSQLLLVADKTGDAFVFTVNNIQQKVNKILGHLSLLTDILLTPDSKYIVTCDRDEKIRVSNYPHTYEIESFCLGHREFVTSLHILPHHQQYLLSTSGDGTVRVWDYVQGKQLCSVHIDHYIADKDIFINFQNMMKDEDIEVECLPIKYSSCSKYGTSSVLAVSLHMSCTVLVFEISNISDALTCKLLDKIIFQGNLLGISLTSECLWVLLSGDCVTLEQWSLNNSKYTLHTCDTVCDQHGTQLSDDEIIQLYKRKFDNVQEYQKRKKQRLGIN